MPDGGDGQIGFEQVGIASVLTRYRLQVPPNQREYAWEDEHVLNLFDDIARAISEGEASYFLGTLVTISRNEVLEVVDGQQRLATTTLLLHAIVTYLAERDSFIADAIRNETLFRADRRLREAVPRLTLNLTDNEFFKSMITEGETLAPSKPSHHLLLRAFELAQLRVSAIVAGLNEQDHGDALNNWADYLGSQASVALLIVPDDANAYRMFETLNDRGLRVSQADLIKNYLYSRAGERLPEVQNRWALIRGALDNLSGDDSIIDFTRHSLIAVSGFVRQAQLYERVQTTARSSPQAVRLATTLEELSGIYVAIQNPEHEHWNEYQPSARRAIEVLNLFDIKPLRPIMLAASAKLSRRECEASFRLLVVLAVRLLIASSTRSGTVEQALSGAATKIYSGDIRTAAALKRQLSEVMPSDTSFKNAFETTRVNNAKFARYYLRSLQVAQTGDESPWLIPVDDHTVVNLEHVLPRNPMGNWPQFGSDEDSRPFASRLGNQALVLADDNSRSGSEPFEVKRAMFVDAPYPLTAMIGEKDEWTAEAISERQVVMAALAVSTWAVP